MKMNLDKQFVNYLALRKMLKKPIADVNAIREQLRQQIFEKVIENSEELYQEKKSTRSSSADGSVSIMLGYGTLGDGSIEKNGSCLI